MSVCVVFFFFFQAEDGIRDYKVTGVQTCALPISGSADPTCITMHNSRQREYAHMPHIVPQVRHDLRGRVPHRREPRVTACGGLKWPRHTKSSCQGPGGTPTSTPR